MFVFAIASIPSLSDAATAHPPDEFSCQPNARKPSPSLSEVNLNELPPIPEETTQTDLSVNGPETELVTVMDGIETDDTDAELNDEQLVVSLEGLLFVVGEPAVIERLATALNVPIARVEKGLQQLEAQLLHRGIRLQQHNGSAQLVSAPEMADVIEVFLGLDLNTKLSRAALEALAIIAYRQPVTRPQIESIRGVNSDGVIRTLLHRGLIEEVGRLEQAGRPILYGTTFAFLQYFGLENVDGLPPLDEDALSELAARVMSEDVDQLESPEQDDEGAESDDLDFPQPEGVDPTSES